MLIVGNDAHRARRPSSASCSSSPAIRWAWPPSPRRQRRLAALGLFRRTRITQARSRRRDHARPARDRRGGAGHDARLRRRSRGRPAASSVRSRAASRPSDSSFAPRAFFEIGRRNLFGKNRSINLFTRISLRPERLRWSAGTARSRRRRTSFGFSEYRVLGTFREPRVLRHCGRRRSHRHVRAADPLELQLPPAGVQRGTRRAG